MRKFIFILFIISAVEQTFSQVTPIMNYQNNSTNHISKVSIQKECDTNYINILIDSAKIIARTNLIASAIVLYEAQKQCEIISNTPCYSLIGYKKRKLKDIESKLYIIYAFEEGYWMNIEDRDANDPDLAFILVQCDPIKQIPYSDTNYINILYKNACRLVNSNSDSSNILLEQAQERCEILKHYPFPYLKKYAENKILKIKKQLEKLYAPPPQTDLDGHPLDWNDNQYEAPKQYDPITGKPMDSMGTFKQPAPSLRPEFTVENGEKEGEMVLKHKDVKGAAAWVWQYSPDPFTESSWLLASVSTQATFTVTGLKPGTRYWFRACYVTPKGMSEWCDPYFKIAQ